MEHRSTCHSYRSATLDYLPTKLNLWVHNLRPRLGPSWCRTRRRLRLGQKLASPSKQKETCKWIRPTHTLSYLPTQLKLLAYHLRPSMSPSCCKAQREPRLVRRLTSLRR